MSGIEITYTVQSAQSGWLNDDSHPSIWSRLPRLIVFPLSKTPHVQQIFRLFLINGLALRETQTKRRGGGS